MSDARTDQWALGIPGCVAHSGADPRWDGPSPERIREIQRRCFYSLYGTMYVDGKPIRRPVELFNEHAEVANA